MKQEGFDESEGSSTDKLFHRKELKTSFPARRGEGMKPKVDFFFLQHRELTNQFAFSSLGLLLQAVPLE